MGKYRLAAKVDANQLQIVKDLREVPGLTVETGKDDLLIGYKKRTYWFELKNPNTVGKDGKVRESAIKPDQKRIRAEWTGHYAIVSSYNEIIKEIMG